MNKIYFKEFEQDLLNEIDRLNLLSFEEKYFRIDINKKILHNKVDIFKSNDKTFKENVLIDNKIDKQFRKNLICFFKNSKKLVGGYCLKTTYQTTNIYVQAINFDKTISLFIRLEK